MGRDTIQLETAVSTISQEYLLEFTSEYDISEDMHPELPGPEERIVDFRRLSQLSIIGAAKVSHFEINCRVLNIIPTLNLFCVFYVPSFHSGWMSFSKQPGKNTPQCYIKPLDSLKNWDNRFFWVDERVFPTAMDWRTNAPKDEMPAANTYYRADMAVLNTRRTPIQKQPETLLCLVGLNMGLFNLISALNPSKVKADLHPRVAHEAPLLTATVSRVIDMEDPNVETESFGTPSSIEKSPLDFDNENPSSAVTEGKGTKDQAHETVAPKILLLGNMSATGVASEVSLDEEVAAMEPRLSKKYGRRVNDGADANAPPKQAFVTPADTPADTKVVNDPDPLSYVEPQPHPKQSMTQSFEIPIENVATMEAQDTRSAKSAGSGKSTSFPSMVGSPRDIYQPGWGMTNRCLLDTPDACQDVVDHIVPPGYFPELRHMPNAEFLSQYNKNLA
nr:hypothetical protein [Tanacetum cinerariifolium]